MSKPIIISDPYPRSLELIFKKQKLIQLKKKYKIISSPKKNKKIFYEQNISKAVFILGQPYLPTSVFRRIA